MHTVSVPTTRMDGNKTNPERKLPSTLPTVFAAYTRPAAAPSAPPPAARTRSGKVAPMNSAGGTITTIASAHFIGHNSSGIGAITKKPFTNSTGKSQYPKVAIHESSATPSCAATMPWTTRPRACRRSASGPPSAPPPAMPTRNATSMTAKA